MHKPLIRSGNSLALVIDKPLRRVLGLGPSRIVRVTTDGRRLIVEAVPESQIHDPPIPPTTTAVPPAVLIDAPKVARQLVQIHGMTDEALRRLYPKFRQVGRYMVHADGAEHSLPEDQHAFHRLHVCHEQLVAGRGWQDAMAIAEYVNGGRFPS